MFKSIIYIVVVNQDRLISAVPHLYYHRRLIYRLYFTVSGIEIRGIAPLFKYTDLHVIQTAEWRSTFPLCPAELSLRFSRDPVSLPAG